MNQIKIGKFIAECRKKNNLTQMQLAEKLNITDRAISKWENGKAMPDSSIMLDSFGIFTFAIGMYNCIKIEQTAGYYECAKCHHKYIPTYSNVLWAMHINRTRYMKCPKCNQRSWQKKVISKS